MSFDLNLDPKVRFAVLYLDAGMKVSRISKIIGKSESTLYDWKKKLDNGTNIFEHKSKNFSPKIDDQKRNSIVREAIRSNKSVTSRRLAAKHDVSHTSVCNILKDKGLKFGKEDKNHVLTMDEEENRVKYCNNMLKYKSSKIKQTFFSDEMGVKLSEMSNYNKTWTLPTRKKVKTERNSRDVKINCWGAISWNGATSLHIYKENLRNPLYQGILGDHAMEMEEIYGNRKCYFQQDNLPAHGNVEILDDYPSIELLDFPTYSPDLNPIENMWSTLKYRVACDAPKNEKNLINSIKRNWEELTEVENLRPYIETLEGRYFECIEKKGARLHY
jgi:transposase